ncbi:MAG TPA: HIT family protein [Acidimicrobiia bacterium]|nr:HIT family protein [Acidimicrobiia bacterium]
MGADCLFCRIVAGDTAAHHVTQTQDAVTFLDHRPIFPGHALVVPRAHVETLRDLPSDLVGPFFAEVQRVAMAVQDGMGAQGTFVAENNVVSQSVPHLHVHVVPRRRKDGLRGFFWPRTRYEDDAAAAAAAAAIRAALPWTSTG